MSGFLALVSFIVGCIFLVGIIKGNTKMFKMYGRKKNAIAWIITSVIFVFSMNSWTGSSQPSSTTAKKETKTTSPPSAQKKEATQLPKQDNKATSTIKNPQKEEPSLGYSAEEFRKRFNKASDEFKINLKITSIKVEPGQVQDTFQYQFTKSLGMVGTINKKDRQLRNVMIIGQGDGTSNSGFDIILSMGAVIAATNPDLNQSARGEVLKELGLMDENVDLHNLNKSTIRNNVKYNITSSDQIGIMFAASNASDN